MAHVQTWWLALGAVANDTHRSQLQYPHLSLAPTYMMVILPQVALAVMVVAVLVHHERQSKLFAGGCFAIRLR
jgi:hypothetical protein